jgi:hypothetical protein
MIICRTGANEKGVYSIGSNTPLKTVVEKRRFVGEFLKTKILM